MLGLWLALGLALAAPKPVAAHQPPASKPAPVKPTEHLCPRGEAGSRRMSVQGECKAPKGEAGPRAEAAPAAPPQPKASTVVVAAPLYPLPRFSAGYGPTSPKGTALRPGLRDCDGLGLQPKETANRPSPVLLFEERLAQDLVKAGDLGKACWRIAVDSKSPAAIAWYNLAALRDRAGAPDAGLVALARAQEIGLPAGLGEAAAALLLEHAQAAPSAE